MQSGIAERETRLLHQARHDGATGLPNRLHAEEWLAQRLATMPPGEQFGLVLLAVTNLQEISASLGFDIAGELIATPRPEPRRTARRQQPRGTGGCNTLRRGRTPVPGTRHRRVACASCASARAGHSPPRASDCRPQWCSGRRWHQTMAATPASCCAVRKQRLKRPSSRSSRRRCSNMPATKHRRRALQLGADLPQALQSGQLYMQYQPKFRMTDRTPARGGGAGALAASGVSAMSRPPNSCPSWSAPAIPDC